MTVQSGRSCGSRRWSFGGILKQLYLASAHRHGKVFLSFPGGYRYVPSPGYLGDDTFTLICTLKTAASSMVASRAARICRSASLSFRRALRRFRAK
jgi:hypothetical protein